MQGPGRRPTPLAHCGAMKLWSRGRCGAVDALRGVCRPSLTRPGERAKAGGEAGIRTLGRVLKPYNGLANRRLQPLGHLTVSKLPRILRVSRQPSSCWPPAVPKVCQVGPRSSCRTRERPIIAINSPTAVRARPGTHDLLLVAGPDFKLRAGRWIGCYACRWLPAEEQPGRSHALLNQHRGTGPGHRSIAASASASAAGLDRNG